MDFMSIEDHLSKEELKVYYDLDFTDQKKVEYLMENFVNNLGDALADLGAVEFYPGTTIREYIQDNLHHFTTDELIKNLDYEKLERSLEIDGVTETDEGVFESH